MRTNRLVRFALGFCFTAGLLTSIPGCGSGKPADGTQKEFVIPKAEAQKQNDAYKDYAKQNSKRSKR